MNSYLNPSSINSRAFVTFAKRELFNSQWQAQARREPFGHSL
nr:MAG TPA: hypothetical protein [Caudoviricetes sp.]DAR09758.1 MAG TPA: hypothetical protein [Caudoviricetes sp.]